MESIHVVYGSNSAGKTARALSLAVEHRTALIHEIGDYRDLKLIAASRYHHCIAILNAGDERHARSRLQHFASRAKVDLCPVTFDPAPVSGSQ